MLGHKYFVCLAVPGPPVHPQVGYSMNVLVNPWGMGASFQPLSYTTNNSSLWKSGLSQYDTPREILSRIKVQPNNHPDINLSELEQPGEMNVE